MNNTQFERRVLFFVIPLAVVLHIVGFGLVQGMKIDALSMKRALMENQYVSATERDATDRFNEDADVAQRNIELAQTFIELVKERKPKPEQSITLPQASDYLSEVSLGDESDDITTNDEQVLSLAPHESEDSDDPFEMYDPLFSDFEDSDPLPTDTLEATLFAQDEYKQTGEEPTKALQAATGTVLDDVTHSHHDTPCMKVGALEAGSIVGNSADDRPGMMDHGVVKSIEESVQNIIDNTETDTDIAANTEVGIHHKTKQPPRYETPTSSKAQRIGHIARSDDFDIDIAYAPKAEGGYLFRIALTAKDNVAFKQIQRNITFLVDKSHSISKKRYDSTRRALMKVLNELNEEDTFNIVFFDSHINRFKERHVPATVDNIVAATVFISRQSYGGMFASTDLYASLDSLVPKVVAENEINIGILISDGDTYMEKGRQRHEIRKWTAHNDGKVTLYSLASGKKNNFQLLNLLSVINKGYLYTSSDNHDLYYAMKKILHDINAPIGKDLTATAVVKNETMALTLAPSKNRIPNLFENQPLVLYGATNTLGEFYLFFQGKYYDKRINIKRLIALNSARKVSQDELRKMWSVQQAYSLYERFLIDGNSEHVRKAKALLKPFRIPSPF